MTGLEIAAPTLGKLIIGKVFGEGVKRSESFIRKIHELNNREKSIQNYLKAIERVKRVRTLSYTDKDAIFENIYVPLNITSSSNTNYLIDEKVNIIQPRPINIVGRAGQGKSTILRRLFLNDVLRGENIPFFLELKYFRECSLESNLINEFKKWGLTLDESTVLDFISSENVTLYLDAFDEIPTEHVTSVLNQITQITNACDCKVILTSRPNTAVCHTENIDIFHVSDLTHEQVHLLLDIACSSKNQATSLKQALSIKPHALEFAKSPILVILLQIVFAHSNAVPSSLNDFYNRVYLTLYHRHDELKTNVARSFKAELTCDESEKIFHAFCYLSLMNHDLSFTKEVAIQHIGAALNIRGYSEIKPEHYFNDVFHVTNIIQEDGYDNYTFFHRSLQEFYSYKFIKDFFSVEKKQQFFKLCLDDGYTRSKFSLVLRFFDDDRESTSYLENYYLPLVGYIVGSDLNFDIEAAALRSIHNCTFELSGSFTNSTNEGGEVRVVSSDDKFDALGFIDSLIDNISDSKMEDMNLIHILHSAAFFKSDGERRKFNEINKLEGRIVSLEGSNAYELSGQVYLNNLLSESEYENYLSTYKNTIGKLGLIEQYKARLHALEGMNRSSHDLLFGNLFENER